MSVEQSFSEPGVVKNSKGRIIETGWPRIDVANWPNAHNELSGAVARQVEYEKRARGLPVIFDGDLGEALKFRGGTIDVSKITTGWMLEEAIANKLAALGNADQKLRICDLGGGDGSMLASAVLPFRRSSSAHGKLNVTMTTLVDFGLRDAARPVIDQVLEASAELPPDELHEAFDIVTAQYSIYSWSQYPELVTASVSKMLKPNGLFLATIPKQPRNIRNEDDVCILDYVNSAPHLIVRGVDAQLLEDSYIVEMRKLKD